MPFHCSHGSFVYAGKPEPTWFPTLSENAGASGQMPPSRIPTTTFSPALPTPPSFCQAPPALSSPRNDGVEEVSTCRISFSVTATTPFTVFSAAACCSVSFAAKPLYAML